MLLLLLQCASTLPMCGLIWFVQIVHYPLFAAVGDSGFPSYARRHAARTTWIVAPLMLLELASAVALLFARLRPVEVSPSSAWAAAALVGLIWISTGLVQVPLHTRLQQGPDRRNIQRLVRTNWVRTLLWSARSVFVIFWLTRATRP